MLVIETDPLAPTAAGGTWWDVAVPEVSDRAEVARRARAYVEARRRQRLEAERGRPLGHQSHRLDERRPGELGDDMPLETCLAEARAAGYDGMELGRKFPRRAAELRADLAVTASRWSPAGTAPSCAAGPPKAELAAAERTSRCSPSWAARSWSSPR